MRVSWRMMGSFGAIVIAAAAAGFAEIPAGPDVGEPIPRFEARDQTGTLRTFEDLTGPNGLLLLFFRTADW